MFCVVLVLGETVRKPQYKITWLLFIIFNKLNLPQQKDITNYILENYLVLKLMTAENIPSHFIQEGSIWFN